MTGEELRQFAASDRPTLVTAFQATLVDFGYEGLEKETVLKHITSFMDEEPKPPGIIAQFIYGWLEDGID